MPTLTIGVRSKDGNGITRLVEPIESLELAAIFIEETEIDGFYHKEDTWEDGEFVYYPPQSIVYIEARA